MNMNRSFSNIGLLLGIAGGLFVEEASAEFLKDSKATLTLRNYYRECAESPVLLVRG